MDFKTGDFVRFVNERQEGTVTRIFGSGIIGVTIEEDFEIPVAASEIVLVNRAESMLATETAEEGNPRGGALRAESGDLAVETLRSEGLKLAFTEDKALKYLLHRHLVNGSDYELLISGYIEQKGMFSWEWAGRIPAGTVMVLAPVSLKEVETWPVFHFDVLFMRRGAFKPVDPRQHALRLRSKHFSTVKKAIPFVVDPGWLFPLDPQDLEIDAASLREHLLTNSNSVSVSRPRPAEEVDLHLEALPEYNRNSPPQDALKLQLEHFQNNLDAALANNMEKITFIHGVGNGILRHQIHKRISSHPYVRTWKDAGKDKFGYGATEVFLK